MFVQRLWNALAAQFNKLANLVWRADPIAQLQYEYDHLVDQIKDARVGLEQYRGLVDRVTRQVDGERQQAADLERKIRSYLAAGDRETAGRFALELQTAKANLRENESQLALHDTAYGNCLLKVQHAGKQLNQLRDKIQKYDADLTLSRAEAELAKVVAGIRVDLPSDLGRIEQVIQDEIDRNRAKSRVAADLSEVGVDDVRREEQIEKNLGEQALQQFERDAATATQRSRPSRATVQQRGGA